MIRPPRTGDRVDFHHPLVGWTQGTVQRVVLDGDPIEDTPHWGCWVRHFTLGRLWVLGGEIMDRPFTPEKHSYKG